MNRGVIFGCVALLAAVGASAATAQTPIERARYLVDTLMPCHNCHTPMGPNRPQIDKALSGGLRFDEPPFDVTASNITPEPETGIGKWSDADIKKAFRPGDEVQVVRMRLPGCGLDRRLRGLPQEEGAEVSPRPQRLRRAQAIR